MHARRKIETTMADIFGQYIKDFKVLPGRAENEITDPFFCVLAEEVVETVRGSGVYLGDLKFIVVIDSNYQTTTAQDHYIGECMDLVRQLSNTLCNGGMCITDTTTNIIVDGIVQLSQTDALDDQAYGDMVALRVGFREVDNVQAVAPAPNEPTVIPPWWTPSGFKTPQT